MSDIAEEIRPAAPNPAEAFTSQPSVIARHDHESRIAQPSTFLLPRGKVAEMQQEKPQERPQEKPMTALDKDQQKGLKCIRDFLKRRTSYDVLPLSFRLIILNTDLLVKKSLTILLQNGIVSAPLWDSHTSTFAGLLTTSDYINVIQYYWQNPEALNQIDQFKLSSLRDIEKAIGVLPLETISVHPARPLYDACRQMLQTRARRIPLVDVDDETGKEMVVSVITQYRILKFISVNVDETEFLKKSVSEIGLGTYGDLQTANMDTPVIDVIHMMVKHSISSVPIVDTDSRVLNLFEAVDVITIIKGGVYDGLTLTVGEALANRAEDFAGIYTVHRLVVIDEEQHLKGVISLSDILQYALHSDLAYRHNPDFTGHQNGYNRCDRAISSYSLIPFCGLRTRDNMASFGNGFSRASSATLSLRRQQQDTAAAPFSDDASIAQNLLRGQVIPIRGSSIKGFPSSPNIATGLSVDGPSNTDEPSNIVQQPRVRRGLCSSNTWTSSSAGGESEKDDSNDRTQFIEEFNRLAEKHGVRRFIPSEYEDTPCIEDGPDRHGNWLSRKIFGRTSSSQTPIVKSKKTERRDLKRMRSISDSLRLRGRRDSLKDRDLVELVRLCGSSPLYLPAEYAASSLTLPTCIRATAQYLIQHGALQIPIGGMVHILIDLQLLPPEACFRIPGSQHTIGLIYEHYCSKGDEGHIAGTVRCPTLPEHIDCDVHDVASAFKRFLSGIPGGILGSLPLFDALVSIQTHLRGDPELTRTKHTKVRARLIALSISTLRSTYRRELICAVLGLLCMVGREAETARREDDRGRPLPTSDLMGYKPLGIVFGPLLVGDLLENYNIRLANGHGSLVLTPLSPPKTKKERKKYKSAEEGVTFNNTVDKIKVACEIMEMLITHWRDIVRHIKNLDSLTAIDGSRSVVLRGRKTPILRPSMSESFSLRKPPDWAYNKPGRNVVRDQSPTPPQRNISPRSCPMHAETLGKREEITEEQTLDGYEDSSQLDPLLVTKQRSRQRLLSGDALKNAKSMGALSAALVKEHPDENEDEDSKLSYKKTPQSVKPYSSTKNGKENDQKSSAIEKDSGCDANGIIRSCESQSSESEVLPPVTDYKDFGYDKTPNTQASRPSQDTHSKYGQVAGPPALSLDNNQVSMQASSSSYRKNRSSRDSHIRFAPDTSPIQNRTEFRRRQGLTTSDRSKGNSPTDPLSRVSHEDDLASLTLVYTPKSTTAHGHDGQSSSQTKFHGKTGSVTPLLTASVEPKSMQAKSHGPHQTASPATLSKVASIREMFRKRKSESRSSKSAEDHYKSELSMPVTEYRTEPPSRKVPFPEPAITPKKVNVKAIAERFDTVKATPPPSSPSPSKSALPAPITPVDTRRSGGVVSPYTINPPPSPSRSVASIKSGKSVRSFHNAALAQRFQTNPRTVITYQNISTQESPKRLRARGSATSGLLSTSNSLSVPLQPVRHPPPIPNQQAGMDGAYSSIGSSDTLALTSSEFEAAHNFLRSQSQLAHDATLSMNTLTRGNTVLHAQIRSLQQQVYEKTEQIRQLQRRVEMRSSSGTDNIGLAEQLREAREETETWRRRAEGAERKLELMEIISARNNARIEEQRGLGYQDEGVPSGDDGSMRGRGYSVDGGMRTMIAKRRMFGMTSSEESAGSSGTVVRERSRRDEYGSGSGSEMGGHVLADSAKNNDWASQTLSIMDGLKSWEN
ncbi:hypothetical protein EYC84_008448 [Monilinia fructicola]|uniref:Rho-GAP domain-containing protein n=1 Tax=Monilinia fructicola TaxID=38448 RepID=A0A5M9JLV5_MONFR|nr:hypothetical protein EYC84_008448 [Monilinia fructicola]